jgi:Na+/H+ antiporter NhaD/arsenite permease-like protein
MRVRYLWLLVIALVVALIPSHRTAHAQAPARGELFTCTVTVSTATSLTAVGGDCAASAHLGRALYITDILAMTNAGAIAADSYLTLKYGTGTTCGTGTTVFWFAMTTAATQSTVIDNRATPLRLPRDVDVCWINSTAGSKGWIIAGYLGS